MDDFFEKFFSTIYKRKEHAEENNCCKYDDQLLQLFTSSLHLAALIASFVASKDCTVFGRLPAIKVASLLVIVAAIISGLAPNEFVLIVGRIIFGVGVGFGNEKLHHQITEELSTFCSSSITVGILSANLVYFPVSSIHPYGWRLALGLSGFPGLFLFFGSLIIMEKPSSQIERGYETEGRATLQKIRGVDDVKREPQHIRFACEMAKKAKNFGF